LLRNILIHTANFAQIPMHELAEMIQVSVLSREHMRWDQTDDQGTMKVIEILRVRHRYGIELMEYCPFVCRYLFHFFLVQVRERNVDSFLVIHWCE
jgi:hypothetical protein